jgi:hypothetical protein
MKIILLIFAALLILWGVYDIFFIKIENSKDNPSQTPKEGSYTYIPNNVNEFKESENEVKITEYDNRITYQKMSKIDGDYRVFGFNHNPNTDNNTIINQIDSIIALTPLQTSDELTKATQCEADAFRNSRTVLAIGQTKEIKDTLKEYSKNRGNAPKRVRLTGFNLKQTQNSFKGAPLYKMTSFSTGGINVNADEAILITKIERLD